MKRKHLRFKRSLAAMLTVAMVFTGSSFQVFADELADNDVIEIEAQGAEAQEEEVFAEGEEITIEEESEIEEIEAVAAEDEIADEESVKAEAAEAEEETAEDDEASGYYIDPTISENSVAGAIDSEWLNSTSIFTAAYTGTKTKPTVELTWKAVSGAAKYNVYRLNNDDVFDTTYTKVGTKYYGNGDVNGDMMVARGTKEKSCIDYDPYAECSSGVYVLEAITKSGNVRKTYVTVPTARILSYDLGEKISGDDANVIIKFAAQPVEGYEYDIYTRETTKEDWSLSNTVTASDCTWFYEGGKYALIYEDTNTLSYGDTSSKRFYRIQARYNDVKAKYSAAVKASAYYEAPVVLGINSPKSKHGLCYDAAVIYVDYDKTADYAKSDSTKYFEVYRASAKGGYAKVASTKVAKCVNYAVGPDAITIGSETFSVSENHMVKGIVLEQKLNPEVQYSYKVRVMVEGKKTDRYSSFSDSFDAKVEFPRVTMSSSSYPKIKSRSDIIFQWKAEKCAKKYEIYRSKLKTKKKTRITFTDYDKSINEWNTRFTVDGAPTKTTLKDYFDLIGTVTNNKENGMTLEFEDTKLEKGYYYNYVIVPVNGDNKGYGSVYHTCIMGNLAKATGVKTESTLKSITLKWNSVDKAKKYIVQRTTLLGSNDEPYFDEEDTDNCWSGEYFSSDKGKKTVFKKRTLKQTTASGDVDADAIYYYRVLAFYGKYSSVSDWVTGTVQAAKVTDVSGAVSSRDGALRGLKLKFKTPKAYSGVKDVDKYEIAIATPASTKKATIFGALDASAEDADLHKDIDSFKKNKEYSALFSEVEVERGRLYVLGVRPVAGDVKGVWQYVKISLPSDFNFYPDELALGEKKDGHSKEYAYKMTGSGEKFILDFDKVMPGNADPTYANVTINVWKSDSMNSKSNKVKASYNTKSKSNDKHYFMLKAPEGHSKGECYVTVTLSLTGSARSETSVTKGMWIYVN